MDSDAELKLNTELALKTVKLSKIKDLYEKVMDRRASLEHISPSSSLMKVKASLSALKSEQSHEIRTGIPWVQFMV